MKILLVKSVLYIKPGCCCVCGQYVKSEFAYWYIDSYYLQKTLETIFPAINWRHRERQYRFVICTECYRKWTRKEITREFQIKQIKSKFPHLANGFLVGLHPYNLSLVYFIAKNYPIKVVT